MSSNGSSVDESSSSPNEHESAAEFERNRGEQPLNKLLLDQGLKHHDVVAAAVEVGMTHKLVTRAAKGRWLTMHSRLKVLDAVNRACKTTYRLSDLFNY